MVTSCDKHCVNNTPESVNRKHFLANKIWLNGKNAIDNNTHHFRSAGCPLIFFLHFFAKEPLDSPWWFSRVSALSFLQCFQAFNTFGWVTGREYVACKYLCQFSKPWRIGTGIYRPHILPVTQPKVLKAWKHWRKLRALTRENHQLTPFSSGSTK